MTLILPLHQVDNHASEWPALEAFEGLLDTLTNLEDIHIVVSRMRALPRPSAITHHRKTLTSLTVHTEKDSFNSHTYSQEDFGTICIQCTELRQLSIMLPEVTLNWADKFLSTSFAVFLVRSSLVDLARLAQEMEMNR